MKQTIDIMIVDDDAASQQSLIDYLEEYDSMMVCAKAFSVHEARLRLRTSKIDAIFLDVELGNESGFDLAAYVKENYPEIAIVFITGHMELALNGYDYEPLDYLVKPIDIRRLGRAVERLEKAFFTDSKRLEDEESIILETASGIYFVPTSDILYCELRNRKIYVGRKNGEEICCMSTIDKMEKSLKGLGFIKIYQSVLVRQSEIISVEKDERGQTYHVCLRTGGKILPASRKTYYDAKRILGKS